MTKMISRIGLFAFLGLLATSQTGCLVAAAAAGAGGTVAYVRGDTEVVLDGDPAQVTAAGEAALRDMDLKVVSSEASGVDGKVVARTARDKKLTLVVESVGDGISKVSVRAGNFGDDALQQRVLEKIRARLAAEEGEVATAPAESVD